MSDLTEQASAQSSGLSVFLPFDSMEKTARGTLRVFTTINDETVDDQGEIVDYDGAKVALDEFMKFANVREMHQPSAVGIVESITHDDALRKTTGIIEVVDPLAIQKVEAGVYKGTSVGGWKRGKVMEKVGGVTVGRITRPVINELSLVDRPSRPTALLSMLKVAGIEEPAEDEIVAEPPTRPETDPINKASVADAEPDPAPVAAAEEMAKGPVTDAAIAMGALDMINRLLEGEGMEGEAGHVALLRVAQRSMAAFVAGESEEVGVEPVAQEHEVMEMASPTGDLAPAADPQADILEKWAAFEARMGAVEELLASRTAPAEEPIDGESLEKMTTNTDLLAKVARSIVDTISPAILEQVRTDMQSSLSDIRERLEKVSSQPIPGGPLRYAMDDRRFLDAATLMGSHGDGEAEEAAALSKRASEAIDPVAREALGKMAAARQIALMNRNR